MHKYMGLVPIAGIFALISGAHGQTPSTPTANTKFDGTYAIVSVTRLNETFNYAGRLLFCPNRKGSPLTIVNGQARAGPFYQNGEKVPVNGTVGPHGELAMRLEGPANRSRQFMFDVTFSGVIDADGTVRARWTGIWCRYDFVWQKVTK